MLLLILITQFFRIKKKKNNNWQALLTDVISYFNEEVKKKIHRKDSDTEVLERWTKEKGIQEIKEE